MSSPLFEMAEFVSQQFLQALFVKNKKKHCAVGHVR